LAFFPQAGGDRHGLNQSLVSAAGCKPRSVSGMLNHILDSKWRVHVLEKFRVCVTAQKPGWLKMYRKYPWQKEILDTP
jgi:hypothetical protein